MGILEFFGFKRKKKKGQENKEAQPKEAAYSETAPLLEIIPKVIEKPPLTLALETLEQQGGDFSHYIEAKHTKNSPSINVQEQLLSYKIFGEAIYSIPCHYFRMCGGGDDDNFSIPFRFFDLIIADELSIFRENYKGYVPEHFHLIGYLNDSDVLVFNENTEALSIFHVSDVADTEMLVYKLKRSYGNLTNFLQQLEQQTVCCFMKPGSGLYFDRFEIQGNTLIYECDPMTSEGKWGEDDYDNYETCYTAYIKLVQASIDKGYVLNFGPNSIQKLIVK